MAVNNDSCICKKCATAISNSGIKQVKAKLYSIEFCHLCKEAEAIIREAGSTTLNIDIAKDDGLFEKYSTRIPVLKRIDNGAELDWPFDVVAVSRFLV